MLRQADDKLKVIRSDAYNAAEKHAAQIRACVEGLQLPELASDFDEVL
jgi:hypothetical protein